MAFIQASQPKTTECFFCGGDHYLNKCPYKHQMKKIRMEEERNPAPTTSANTLLIQDELSCTVVDSSQDEDENSVYSTDIYDFAFATIDCKAMKTQPLTNTQQIVLSQKSHGKKINPNWILLDSQSTINIFNNKSFFKYIRKCRPHENVRCSKILS